MKIGHETRAVVTGGGSGLGRALAKRLAAQGAAVVVSDVRGDAARAVADEIAAAGGTSHALVCDVTRAGDVELLAAESARLLGPVDLLVNNAGIGAGGLVGDVSLEDWRRAVDVNLWGVIYGCHFLVPGMRARRRGHVLNVASAAAFGPGARPDARIGDPGFFIEVRVPNHR
jgi:NAD(P)-dependent dehydrogenase (short-subunit alcohol dehydrogenase family)